MQTDLNKIVYEANMALVNHHLVTLTWGNASAIDRKKGLVIIKPSGVDYNAMSPDSMVAVDMNGSVLEGNLKPSSDTATHIALYKAFPSIGGVVHTHSEWATSWAQAGTGIPAYGTTHADHFYDEVPCTRPLTSDEIHTDYELNTGLVIAECFAERDPQAIPGVLVHSHAPFTWGKTPIEAVHNAIALEEIAKMAYRTQFLGRKQPIDQYLLDKHYRRKHGKDSYYGQK